MKNLLLAISAFVLIACKPYDPVSIHEVPRVDGYVQYDLDDSFMVWVDEDTGCQYWVSRGNYHAGRLAMSPRYLSSNVVAGCRED